MAEMTTLKVPKEYVEAFRLGLMRELKSDGEWFAEQAEEARKSLAAVEHPEWHRPNERPKEPFSPFRCIASPLQGIQALTGFLRQLEGETESGVTLRGDPGSLKHAVEATGHDRAEKHLLDVEFGGAEAIEAAAVVAWAAGEAERLETEAGREAVAA